MTMLKESDLGSNSYGKGSHNSYSSSVLIDGRGSSGVEQKLKPGKTGDNNPSNLVPKVAPNPEHTEKNKGIDGYRVSLSSAATVRERKIFDDYRKEVIDSGWSLLYVNPKESEEVAYIATRKGSRDEALVAAAIVKLEFQKAIEEAYGIAR